MFSLDIFFFLGSSENSVKVYKPRGKCAIRGSQALRACVVYHNTEKRAIMASSFKPPSKKARVYCSRYQSEWETDKDFHSQITKSDEGSEFAYCKLCKQSVKVSVYVLCNHCNVLC